MTFQVRVIRTLDSEPLGTKGRVCSSVHTLGLADGLAGPGPAARLVPFISCNKNRTASCQAGLNTGIPIKYLFTQTPLSKIPRDGAGSRGERAAGLDRGCWPGSRAGRGQPPGKAWLFNGFLAY